MTKIFFIGTGGFAGAVLRYLVSLYVSKLFPQSLIPLGTLAVNIAGSFVMGAANGFIAYHSMIPENLKYILMVGFLGAFTTYSTFSIEAFFLLKDNSPVTMLLYIFFHLILGIGAAVSGYYLMRIV